MEDFKVLLVDDEIDFVKSLSERLEMRDLKADTAFDGEQALKSVKDKQPNVIVLDLKMPGMDGLEVLRLLKKAHPDVQVVILTGHGTEKDKEKALEMGAFAYLQKPVEMSVLIKTLKKAYKKFKSIKHSVDTAFMAAAMAQTGETDMARKLMEDEHKEEEEENKKKS